MNRAASDTHHRAIMKSIMNQSVFPSGSALAIEISRSEIDRVEHASKVLAPDSIAYHTSIIGRARLALANEERINVKDHPY